jgi:hypothetical protein
MEIAVRLDSGSPLSIKSLDAEEIAAFDRAADAAGVSRSEWARRLLRDLEARAERVRVPARALARLILLAAAAQTSLAEELVAARDRHLAMVEADRLRRAEALADALHGRPEIV